MDPGDAIAFLHQDPATTGVFSDFDGTLAPIVDHPQDAYAVDGAIEALASLASSFGLVGIVSARSLEDLRTRVKAPGVLLAGAYGRERSDRPVRRRTEGWETVTVAATAAVSKLEGVRVERKGTGVALHFRGAPEHQEAVEEIAGSLAREFSLELRPGRMVCDLIIPGPGKGQAIAGLIAERGLRRVLVAGDDVADVEAFEMLRAPGVVEAVEAVVVGVASDEAPDDLATHADLMLEGPGALARFLQALADA